MGLFMEYCEEDLIKWMRQEENPETQGDDIPLSAQDGAAEILW